MSRYCIRADIVLRDALLGFDRQVSRLVVRGTKIQQMTAVKGRLLQAECERSLPAPAGRFPFTQTPEMVNGLLPASSSQQKRQASPSMVRATSPAQSPLEKRLKCVGFVTLTAKAVEFSKGEFVWDGYIQIGVVTLLCGAPGSLKSFFLSNVALSVTTHRCENYPPEVGDRC